MAAATDDDTEPDTELDVMPIEPDEPAERGAPRLPTVLLAVGVALVVAAAAVAVWFGVTWISAGTDDSLAFSNERDEVTQQAEVAIATMNTLDYKNVDAGLKRWESVTAGALHDELVNRKTSSKQAIEQAKTTTEAQVRSSAVTELNTQTGTATIIAAVRVQVTVEGQAPVEKWMRIEGSMIRTGDGWKLQGLTQVPYSQAVPQ
jgi:Mce-associated membrane protein